VAIDRSRESVRPWVEAAAPTHPSLIDTEWAFADLYNIVNVPTVLWIDEDGRIVRPHDTVYVTDEYRKVHGIDPAPHLARIRAWVTEGAGALSDEESRAHRPVPDDAHQQARAEFALAMWLSRHGRDDRAEEHFVRAGELAPHDFTIRRGSMTWRGIDAAGPAFRAMVAEWMGQGRRYYETLPEGVGEG
jgi:hypothetical protein